MVAWEQREKVHAFVELSCLSVWISRVSPVLDDGLAHLFCDHALDKDTRVKRLIHISHDDFWFVQELAAADQVDDPAKSSWASIDFREEFFEQILPAGIEFKAISLW